MTPSVTRLLLLGAFYFVLRIDAIEVVIKQGKLEGAELQSRNGTKYYAFLGIPFAKPPINELRFESPQEPDGWDGVRNATIHPPPCIQKQAFSGGTVTGQEDCLYLNVYTSAVKQKFLPTAVIIHGGGFVTGSAGLQDPWYLMDNQLVVVSIQYRLNVLGFLSAEDEVLPGNYGMKDQVAALKWVQRNIVAFGGNPEKVTIIGESAGGACVHLHMHSPLSKGLFHQAISQSGAALSPWALTPPSLAGEKARSFGILSGCPPKPTRALVECLRTIPAEELIHTHHKFYIWDYEPNIHFQTVIEKNTVADAFMIENPWRQKVISDVPFIVGLTSGEGIIKAAKNAALAAVVNENYKRLFPLLYFYGYWMSQEKTANVTESIKQYYFGDKKIGLETKSELVDFVTDGFFLHGCVEAALRHTNKTYFYYYDHRNAESFSQFFGTYRVDLGVAHGDDLISLFYLPCCIGKVDGPDFKVSKRMVTYWTNFVQTGNPNGQRELWQPVQSEKLEYLHITTNEDRMETNTLKEKHTFWKNLAFYPTYSSDDLGLLGNNF